MIQIFMKIVPVLILTILLFPTSCNKEKKFEPKPRFLNHKRKDMVLVASGDFICARDFDKTVEKHGPDYSFIKAKEHFEKADIVFANLECVVSDNAKLRSKNPKHINYNAPSTVIPAIKNSGFDIFSIANNHTYDLGASGLKDFRKHLEQSNLLFGGAGKNYKEASKPLIMKVNGLKIAFLFYNATGTNFCAGEKKAGYNCMPFYKKKKALKKLKKDLKKVRKADLVFLSIHWGKNYKEEPTDKQVEFAHAAIDAGVDAILGHSSHIFQGVEVYKNKPVIYDMGDVFLRRKDGWDSRSFFFNINIKNTKFQSLELFPIFINDAQIRLADGKIAKEIISRFIKMSKRFNTRTKRYSNRIVIEMNQKPNIKSFKKPVIIQKKKKLLPLHF